MPAPASISEFLEIVLKSGVADDVKFKNYVQKQTEAKAIPQDIAKFASMLVRDGLLTYFQAEQLLQGKWKRFSLGKYKVLEKLGVGGMGQVFLCEHKLMRRRVAVKVLPAAKGLEDASRERFYREARAVAALDHPNIVRAYDIDQDEGLHFLVMEFVDGINLQDIVKKFAPLDPTRACHYVYAAAVGLQYANEMGIIHRDIKPANILVDRSGVIKILDMGLARFFHEEDDGITKKYDENVLGTADYLAPEQAIDSHTVDIRADLYSLGGTFYYLLTGSAPFPDGSIAQKLLWHQTREPRPIRSIRPEIPLEIAAIVERLMKKQAADRYQTPSELMAALSPWVQTPISPPSDKELPRLSPAAAGPNSSSAPRATSGILLSGGSLNGQGLSTSGELAIGTLSGSPAGSARTSTSGEIVTPDGMRIATVSSPVSQTAGEVWSSLDVETQAVATTDTMPSAPRRSRKESADKPKPRGKRFWGVLSIAVLVAITATGIGAYLIFHTPEVQPKPQISYQLLYVTKGTSPGDPAVTFPSLIRAIGKAKNGTTIQILDDNHEEQPFFVNAAGLKDLTIEGGNSSKMVVWTLPATVESKELPKALFEIRGADGMKVRGITFDAAGRLDSALSVSRLATDLRFENVVVKGAKISGIHVERGSSDPARPLVFDNVRVLANGSECGIRFGQTGSQSLVSHTNITNSRIEGSARAAFRFESPSAGVTLSLNRVFNFQFGIEWLLTQPVPAVKLTVAENTFHTIAEAGIKTETPLVAGSVWNLTRNYFAKTVAIATSNDGNASGFVFADNARDTHSKEGKLITGSIEVGGYELPEPKPNSDATFLRYPASSPLKTVGPNKVSVGVP